MNSQRCYFFYQLSLQKQLALLKRLKYSTTEQTNFHELARELNLPAPKVSGWLSVMRNRYFKNSTIEEVPQAKIDTLNEEFRLSETLSDDRLLMLSHVLKIEQSVIEKFFSSKRDGRNLASASALPEPNPNDENVFADIMRPCVRLSRYSIMTGETADFTDSNIFTPEQLIILRDQYSQLDQLDRAEADRVASQFGGHVTGSDIMNWYIKTQCQRSLPEKEPCSAEKSESSSNYCQERSRLVSLAVQNALFEEYKKSPVLTPHRRDDLLDDLNVQSSQIDTFFQRMRFLLRGQTENNVLQQLTSYSKPFLSKLISEYNRSRYIIGRRSCVLAKQLSTSRRVICDWFINARLYELLSGNRSIPMRVPSSSPAHQSRTVNFLKPARQALARAPRRYETSTLELLYNSFKQSCQVSPWCLHRIMAQSNLTDKQIHKWFSRKRERLRSLAFDEQIFQSRYRNQNLNQDQVKILEKEFDKTPYVSETTENTLADTLEVSRRTIKNWFARQREYNLIAFGMPELLPVLRGRIIKKPNATVHDRTKNCQESANAREKAPTVHPTQAPKYESNFSKILSSALSEETDEDFHTNFDEICDLLNAPKVDGTLLPENLHSQDMKVKSSLPGRTEVVDSETEKGNVVSPPQVFELQTSNVDTEMPSSPSVENGSKAANVSTLNEIISSEKMVVTFCKNVDTNPENLLDPTSLPDVSKPLVNHLEVGKTEVATSEKLVDEAKPLLDVSEPLASHLENFYSKVVMSVKLPDDAESPSHNAQSAVDDSEVGKPEATSPAKLPADTLSMPEL